MIVIINTDILKIPKLKIILLIIKTIILLKKNLIENNNNLNKVE